MTDVLCNFEMDYAGTKRYKGEIFTLQGALNDEKMVRIGYLKPVILEEVETKVVDDTGRIFANESSRIEYRKNAPNDVIVVRRGRGRPKKSESADAVRVPLATSVEAPAS